MRLGAHVSTEDPLGDAARLGLEVVQLSLTDMQSWRKPPARDDAEELRASDVPIYVHAPFVMNPASPNPRVRHPSRKTMQQTLDAAADIGARGVVVHGGHVGADTDPAEGVRNWRKALESLRSDAPLLIENTAGGDNAMARSFDDLARLWEGIAGGGLDVEVGFVLDTCHTHAAGEATVGQVERVRAITGRIDLLHLNDSRDPLGSGRDRHANLGDGTIDVDALVAEVAAHGGDVVLETPTEDAGHERDLALVRERLGLAAG
ncbi:MAG: deoxyribonuclease IV [Actinomycetes bacterium]